jgi:hypothetical protein
VKHLSCVADVVALSRLPGTKIEMSGDDGCRVLHSAFTRRHKRLKVIQNKRWGVELLRVTEQFDTYFRDPRQAHLRREFNRATRAGLTFAPLDPFARLDEIMGINGSAKERQGLPMHPDYLDVEHVRAYFERSADVYGVADSAGVLRAYLCIRVCGEVACVERLLGHADVLRQGVMWVLMVGAIRELVGQRQTEGRPTWLMYDTYFGASEGLRQFKRWIGLEPYRVSWSWRDKS